MTVGPKATETKMNTKIVTKMRGQGFKRTQKKSMTTKG